MQNDKDVTFYRYTYEGATPKKYYVKEACVCMVYPSRLTTDVHNEWLVF